VPVSTVLEIEQIERIKILKFISEMKTYTYGIVVTFSIVSKMTQRNDANMIGRVINERMKKWIFSSYYLQNIALVKNKNEKCMIRFIEYQLYSLYLYFVYSYRCKKL